MGGNIRRWCAVGASVAILATGCVGEATDDQAAEVDVSVIQVDGDGAPSAGGHDAQEAFVSTYLETVEDRDYDAAWEMLSAAFRDRNLSSGIEEYRVFWEEAFGLEILTVDSLSTEPDDRRVRAHYRICRDRTCETFEEIDFVYVLVDNGDGFQIDAGCDASRALCNTSRP